MFLYFDYMAGILYDKCYAMPYWLINDLNVCGRQAFVVVFHLYNFPILSHKYESPIKRCCR